MHLNMGHNIFYCLIPCHIAQKSSEFSNKTSNKVIKNT